MPAAIAKDARIPFWRAPFRDTTVALKLRRPGLWHQDRPKREQKVGRLFRVPIYLGLLATCAVCLATRYGHPTLLYRVTREDGPVEWASVMALLGLSLLVGRRLRSASSRLPRLGRLSGWCLVIAALLAAGEEVSWGQRLFGFQTGETMRAINLQRETNLHNLIPGELFNGLIVFSLGIAFVLVPICWRGLRPDAPCWLPSPELSLLTLDAILINHYRFRTVPEKVGIAVLLVLLAQQTACALAKRDGPLLAAGMAGWLTAGCLFHSRGVLRAANHQYELRELLIVLLVTVWALQILETYDQS